MSKKNMMTKWLAHHGLMKIYQTASPDSFSNYGSKPKKNRLSSFNQKITVVHLR